MNWNRLHRSGVIALPLTAAEAKAHTRIDDDAEDAYLEGLIGAALEFIEGPHGIGIAVAPCEWKLRLDCFPDCIQIPLCPVQKVDSIEYVDPNGDTQTLADFQADIYSAPARVIPAYGAAWPATRAVPNAVTVTFTAGYSPLPKTLRQAMLLLVAHWYENREPVNIGNIVNELPFAVEALLNKFRAGVVA